MALPLAILPTVPAVILSTLVHFIIPALSHSYRFITPLYLILLITYRLYFLFFLFFLYNIIFTYLILLEG